jgi:hypothetical protein
MNIYEKARAIAQQERREAEENATLKSREALDKIVSRRCTTIFIGCLDSIEQKLGHLWGMDKRLRDLNREERLFLEIWKSLRKEILDKGNVQKKALLEDTDCFEVTLLPNYYELELNNEQENFYS